MSKRFALGLVTVAVCASGCVMDWSSSKEDKLAVSMFDASVAGSDAGDDASQPRTPDASIDGSRPGPDGSIDGSIDGSTDGAVDPTTPRLVAKPSPVSFGSVTIGATSGKLSLEIKNEGDGTSDEIVATLSGPDATRFAVDAKDCADRKLAPNESCELALTFAPEAARENTASLEIEGAAPLEVSLTGTGVTPGALVAMPSVGEFMSVPLQGDTNYRDIVFEIQNTGGSTSGTPMASIEGEPAGFSIIEDSCKAQLAPNSKCGVTVRFSPLASGGALGTLLLQAEPGGVLPISLTGVGLAPPSLRITPASTAFANIVDVGATGSESVQLRVTNHGDLPSLPVLTFSNNTDFAITNGCANKTLGGGESCTLDVALKPASAGAKATDITVTNGLSGSNTARVTGTARSSVNLTVGVTGNGTGSVAAPPGVQGNGIACGADCSETYSRTTADPVITLTASYDAATTDVVWSAPCAGSTTSCNVTLGSSNTSVQVSFTKKRYLVSISLGSVGGATGAVSGGGLSCPGTCSVTVDAGTRLTLLATPSSGFYFQGFTGGGCPSGQLGCTTQFITAATTITATFTKPNMIFATSTMYSVAQLAAAGNGNPVTGADALCQARAAASNLSEVRARSFRSLISTQANSLGLDRVAGARGWVRPDARPVGDEASSFMVPDHSSFSGSTSVFYPPALDEFAARVSSSDGTNATLGNGCGNWTSGARADYRAGGIPTSGGYGWCRAYGSPCDYAFRLYCASTDYNAIVTPPARAPGAKIAFVTRGSFYPGGSQGLSSADAMCQAEANAASFTGTFKAFLASTNPATTAVGRFASSGPWVRPDGVSVGSYADLNTNSLALLATIQVTAGGEYVGNRNAWTGASNPTDPSTGPLTCTPSGGLSWTASTDQSGRIGLLHHTTNGMMHNYDDTPCNQGRGLICLQQ